jgi:hypothetical protein
MKQIKLNSLKFHIVAVMLSTYFIASFGFLVLSIATYSLHSNALAHIVIALLALLVFALLLRGFFIKYTY